LYIEGIPSNKQKVLKIRTGPKNKNFDPQKKFRSSYIRKKSEAYFLSYVRKQFYFLPTWLRTISLSLSLSLSLTLDIEMGYPSR